jgi:arylsulfatase A-like enzyme
MHFPIVLRKALVVAAAIWLGSGCASARIERTSARADGPSARTDRRPNVLIVLLDDAGFGDVGCHGNPDVQTPTIDRLYAQSTRLTQFHVQPVCTPTRACLMTGRDYLRTRAIDTLYRDMMDPDEVTIAETFRAAGYRTGIFGKWHLGSNYPMRPIDQGFEEAVSIRGGGMAHWFDYPGNSYFDPVLEHNGKPKRYAGYCNDIFFQEAGRFIKQHRNEPFFCYLATNLPHDPLICPEHLWLPFHERGINEENAIIYGMMKNVDDNLKKLLKQLDDDGQARDTIILFSSDNGPAMTMSEHVARYNAGMRGEKKQVYEGGTRVPCFVRWPARVAAGRDIDRIASPIDIMPTLSEACGVPAPANVKLDGKSLWPLLSGAVPPEQWPDRTLYVQYTGGSLPAPFRNTAARNQRWKLVNGKELYDEQADPQEKNDVAAANPQVVNDLRSQYEAWFESVRTTRGPQTFEPPRIQIGTPHENPSILNRRDWELESRSGDELKIMRPGREELMGHWRVQIVNGGTYKVTAQLKDTQAGPAEVHFQIGDIHLTQRLAPDGRPGSWAPPNRGWPPRLTIAFPEVAIPAQQGNLKVWYAAPERGDSFLSPDPPRFASHEGEHSSTSFGRR